MARRIFDDHQGWEAAARDARAAVDRWAWATPEAMLHHPEPLAWQRAGLSGPGRLLARPPEVPYEETEYGLAADGAIVVSRKWQPGDCYQETIHTREGAVEIWRLADAHGRPVAVTVLRAEDGRWVSSVAVGQDSHGISTYRYDTEGRVVGIDTTDHSVRDGEMRITTDAEYTDDGQPSELTFVLGDRRRLLWRPSASASSAKLRSRFGARLVACAPELVAAALDGPMPIFAVALQYPRERPAEGAIVVYLRSQQDVVAGVAVEPRVLAYWNPAEALAQDAAICVPFETDPELRSLQERLRIGRDAVAASAERDVILGAAKRVRRALWPSPAQPAEPMTVFAVDFEMEHLEDDLLTVLGAPMCRRLAKQGLLPEPGEHAGGLSA